MGTHHSWKQPLSDVLPVQLLPHQQLSTSQLWYARWASSLASFHLAECSADQILYRHASLLQGIVGHFSINHHLFKLEPTNWKKIYKTPCLTHWPLGDLDAILKLQFLISFYWLVSSHCRRIMPWECHGTSPMISQHWFSVMAWCHQGTSHYLSQCWPSSMSPYGVTRPQSYMETGGSPGGDRL